MRFRFPISALLLAGPVLLLGVSRAGAAQDNQIEDNLSSYTGVNAEGYLGPLRDALGASLNSGIFMYGGVPKEGLHLRLEFKGMLVNFSDADRTFRAHSEDYFGRDTTAVAPTVVGDERAVTLVDPSTGASFSFPGGFNIDRFALGVPQLTVGSVLGTEAVGRYITAETGDNEIGNIKLVGLGLRHNISSYLKSIPLDLAVTAFWQKLDVGDDFIEAKATTFGVQAGKQVGRLLGAYAGLSYDSVDMNVSYQSNAGDQTEQLNIDFDNKSGAHLTLGGTLRLGFVHLNGELNQASNTSLAFGLGFGN